MSRGVNKVIIVGSLGQDPELRYTANGSAVANVSVATNESWKDKNTGEQVEKTEWHRIVMFGKLGEIAGQYLRKGSQAYFEGKLSTNKWEDKDGNTRYTTQVICDQMQMLGSKSDRQQEQRPESPQGQTQQAPTGGSSIAGDDGFDDIPFAYVDGRYV